MDKKFGPYELIQQLGKGGFGEVWLAKDPTLGREVALKLFAPHIGDDYEWIQRFKREAQLLAKLEHPHILPIYEFGEHHGRFYLSTKFMKGGSLADLLKKKGALPLVEVVRLAGQVAQALDYAHQNGFIHRDIKPANIFLNAQGQAVVGDFGIASYHRPEDVTEVSLTSLRRGMVEDELLREAGTPNYMAPELWQGQPPTPAVDVYALACVVYELLMGQKLFPGRMLSEVREKHMARPLVWGAGCPAGVAQVLEKALAVDPQARFKTAGEFIRALPAGGSSQPNPVSPSVEFNPNQMAIPLLVVLVGLFIFGLIQFGSPFNTSVNQAPVIERILVSQEFVPAGGTIDLKAVVNDAEKEVLTYSWDAQYGSIENVNLPETTYTAPTNGVSQDIITLTVQDGSNKVEKPQNIAISGP